MLLMFNIEVDFLFLTFIKVSYPNNQDDSSLLTQDRGLQDKLFLRKMNVSTVLQLSLPNPNSKKRSTFIQERGLR